MEHDTHYFTVELENGSPLVGPVHVVAVLMQKWALYSTELGLNPYEFVAFFAHQDNQVTLKAVHQDDVIEYRRSIPFLVHNNVTVYRMWDGDEMYSCHFTTDIDDVFDGDGFDIRELQSPATLFEDDNDEENERQVLREAIDAGEITKDGLNEDWEPEEDSDLDDDDEEN